MPPGTPGLTASSICVISDRFIGDFDAGRRAEALAAMKELCDVAAEVGAKGVITPASYGMHSNRLPPFAAPRTPEEDRDILLDMLGALGSHAAARGVVVYLEPLNRYEDHMVNTLAQGADTLPRRRHAFGATDGRPLPHEHRGGRPPPGAAGRERHGRACASRRQLSGWSPAPATPTSQAAFRALEEIGFDGCGAIECRFSGEPEAGLRAAYDALRRAAA